MADDDDLRQLLRLRNEHPERLGEIDRTIRERFTRTLAVMVLDMAGFSRLTHHYGIVHFLALIERMQAIVLPVVSDRRFGGRLLKTDADNVYAVFPDAAEAADAAHEIQRRLAQANDILPADWDLHVSIGIGHGEMLAVGPHEVYGHEMNLASKLGEDVGGPGDVLCTAAAFARLPARLPAEEREAVISGLLVRHYRLS
jgi:adenylate cyclase